jgi:hypothetical protein
MSTKSVTPTSPRQRKKSVVGKTSQQKEQEDEKKRKLLLSALEDDTPEETEPMELSFGIDDLDITSDDIDLDEIDEDILRFQQDELVQKALQKGVDLREYSKDIEKELRQVEIESIEDYLKESERLADLHQQLCQCDSVLEKMENMLQTFQGSLGNISEEIKTLQDKSFSMNIKLKNRKGAEQQLAKFIQQAVVAPSLVRNICETEVNEAYLDYLITLDMKNDFLKNEENNSTHAAQELIPKLEKLNIKAVSKIRAFLLQKINELKKPKTNTQFLKQNVLLKFKYFNDFLRKNNEEAAIEIRNTYINTISAYYFNSFKTYVANLTRLAQPTATKNDLIVEKESFSLWGSTERKKNVFSVGDRIRILDELDLNSPIVSHVAIEKKETYPYEALFRSMHVLLINTATSEYIFTLDFFNQPQMFGDIFKKTLELLQQSVEQYLTNSFDAIAILIMIRLTHQFMEIMKKRKINSLDDYFNELNLLLWPRYKFLFDQNLDSVKTANLTSLSSSERHSHTVAKRYGEFVSSIHMLNKKESSFKQMLDANLGTLRDSIINLLENIGSRITPPKQSHIFMINSFDLILIAFINAKVAEVEDVSIREKKSIEDVLVLRKSMDHYISLFVEDELTEFYGKMITFIKNTEEKVSKNSTHQQNQQRIQSGEVENIAKEFKDNWKSGVEHISNDIAKNFPNFKTTGQAILQKIYTQLLLYYNRFTNIVKLCWKDPPFKNSIVGPQVILMEIKKYSTDFNN